MQVALHNPFLAKGLWFNWIYKPILKTNTRTTYDSDGIQQNILKEYEQLENDDWFIFRAMKSDEEYRNDLTRL